MASGYFPLYRNDEEAKKLLEAVRLIREVREWLRDDIFSGVGDQWDNTASDGGYLRQLSIACDLVEDCVEKPKSA